MPRVVVFKDEGVIDGEPYGPAKVESVETDPFVCEQGCGRTNFEYCEQPDCPHRTDNKVLGLPYETKTDVEWVTLTTAQEMAETLGLELRRT